MCTSQLFNIRHSTLRVLDYCQMLSMLLQNMNFVMKMAVGSEMSLLTLKRN